LVGKGLFTARVKGEALRSMKAPGTAYSDPSLGKDPQPDHMDRYYTGQSDSQGVHVNSGIPNRAFYLAATAIGGKVWESAGQIWFKAWTQGGLQPWCQFEHFVAAVMRKAQELAGNQSSWVDACRNAFATVGMLR
jgi:Zn-dependent metalloprotease